MEFLFFLGGFCAGCYIQAFCIESNRKLTGIIIAMLASLIVLFGMSFEIKGTGTAGLLFFVITFCFIAPGVIGSIIT